MTKLLHLVLDGQKIGHLVQDRGGALRLTTPPRDGLPRLSLAFPPSDTPVQPRLARAYLTGLLPDNRNVLVATARQLGVSPDNPFALLAEIGSDCPGAIQFLREDQLEKRDAGELHPISEQRIAERLRAFRTGSQAWAAQDEHWSLGGAQAKIALRYEDEQWHEARGTRATSHIIKPGILGLDSQALVEHVCLRTLGHLGLNVARSRFVRFEDEPAIVVERFDRIQDATGTLRRVHQEDLCQATSTLPADKYDVTAAKAVSTLRRAGTPEGDVREFIMAVLANWVLAAPDAHAKNYSVFLGPDGAEGLAPLYDVATGLGYNGWSKMAMGIGGEAEFRRVTGRHVIEFANEVGVGTEEAWGSAATFAKLMPAAFDVAMNEVDVEGAGRQHLERIAEELETYCGHVLTMLQRT